MWYNCGMKNVFARRLFLPFNLVLHFRAFILHPMSFDHNKEHSSIIRAFCFMNRGRLWLRRILFRDWT
ncbi:hypothetical protein L3X38_041459 [Prunus dulcis]|uniref:Uncharacterized protein n=1 Tax=Prunus dulcis TaxID=3755 RepID=A0AAD4UUT2_PRUDU|nr:hypothetical protein L3X38_041459 [Prunus dulcis]